MDSFPKDTHRYAFALVKAARTMPVDMAEKLDHIKQLRFNVQLKELRKRINKRITEKKTFIPTSFLIQ
jgi:GTP-binding protein EngB required for normal cell division